MALYFQHGDSARSRLGVLLLGRGRLPDELRRDRDPLDRLPLFCAWLAASGRRRLPRPSLARGPGHSRRDWGDMHHYRPDRRPRPRTLADGLGSGGRGLGNARRGSVLVAALPADRHPPGRYFSLKARMRSLNAALSRAYTPCASAWMIPRSAEFERVNEGLFEE